MKKLYLLIILYVFSAPVIGQDLNIPAQFLRDESKSTYEAIKTFSQNKWEANHNMILNEINGQSQAYIDLITHRKIKSPEYHKVFMSALKKWTEGDVGGFDNPTTNWKMVLYETNKQLKAKNDY